MASRQHRVHRSSMSRRSKGHDYLGWALVVTALLAPLPMGGTRAFFFMLYAAVVAVLGLFYAVGLYRGHVRPRLPLSVFAVPVILFGLVIFWMLITLLPLGLAAAPEWGALSPLADLAGRITIGPGATFDMLVRYLTYGLFFVLALQVAVEKKRAKTLFRVVYLGIAVHALIALGLVDLLWRRSAVLAQGCLYRRCDGDVHQSQQLRDFRRLRRHHGCGADSSALTRTTWRVRGSVAFWCSSASNVAPLALICLALAFSHSRMGMFVAALGAGGRRLGRRLQVIRRGVVFLAGLMIIVGLITGAVLANHQRHPVRTHGHG